MIVNLFLSESYNYLCSRRRETTLFGFVDEKTMTRFFDRACVVHLSRRRDDCFSSLNRKQKKIPFKSLAFTLFLTQINDNTGPNVIYRKV